MIASISQWKEAFVGSQVHIEALPVVDYCDQLTPEELAMVAESSAIRRHTVSTGRACAKKAIAGIGIDSAAYANGLLRKDDGAVVWPKGCVGSITHTDEWAMAAVIESNSDYQSIGIDIEKIDRVDERVLKVIATEDERAFLKEQLALRWGRVALFSIKESLYKSLRPIYGKYIRFTDVQIDDLDRALKVSLKSRDDAAGNDESQPLFFNPSVKLLLPALATSCDEQRIDIRLAVLDTCVVSFVGYR